jgi:formylglycine-generating enzyme required for sulfatase activity
VAAAFATPNDRMRGFETFIRESQEFSRGDEQKLAAGELDAAERRRLEANVATLAAELPEFERRIEREALAVALASLAEFEASVLQVERALPAVRDRGALAESLARRTVEERAEDWESCLASVRDPAVCPLYAGLELEPLAGLIPLRRNPATGLWEFWLWLSGDEPTLGEDGDWRIGPSTGLVMILVPGAHGFHLGAQADDPSRPNYDPQATSQEGPVQELDLEPFFLARYEMTQGQWFRLTGEWPSERIPGFGYAATTRFTRTHPVEQVSFLEAEREVARWGLALPTEAQWERAARAGTELPYAHTADPAGIAGRDNLKDLSLAGFGNQEGELLPWNDGYPAHAPVDAFPPNAFGFHGMHGNLAEWTRDWHCETFDDKALQGIAPGTGELIPRFGYSRTVRGGHFYVDSSRARVTRRSPMLPADQSNTVGLRPAMPAAKSS